MSVFRITLVVILFIACVRGISAQSPTPADAGKVTEANNCESNAAYFDLIDVKAAESKSIIIIARLGEGETSRLWNQRRLHNIRAYLHFLRQVPEERLITAEGEGVRGRGRIEVYVGGELFVVFVVGRNQDLAGSDCEPGPGSLFYPTFRVNKQKTGQKRD